MYECEQCPMSKDATPSTQDAPDVKMFMSTWALCGVMEYYSTLLIACTLLVLVVCSCTLRGSRTSSN